MITQAVWELIGVVLLTLGILFGFRNAISVNKAESFFVGMILSTILIALGASCFIFRS